MSTTLYRPRRARKNPSSPQASSQATRYDLRTRSRGSWVGARTREAARSTPAQGLALFCILRRMSDDLEAGVNVAGDQAVAERWAELCEAWDSAGSTARLWSKDAGLWTGSGEDRWLGWLEPGAAWGARQATQCALLTEQPVETIVVLGMGGSSLGAELLAHSADSDSLCQTMVLDSIDPQQVSDALEQNDPASTIYVVSSKSGTTLETRVLADLFWQSASNSLGELAGSRFVAISDPGSPLEEIASNRGWAAFFAGVETIGGRYSVLSPFGLVPLALAGGDVE